MALSASSTVADALDQVNNNLLYEGNTTKAQALLEGLRYLRINRAKAIKEDGYELDFDTYATLEKEVERHLAAITPQSSSTRRTFVRGRMRY